MLRRIKAAELKRRIGAYEAQYAMSTTYFLERWRSGECYETPDFRDWAMLVKALELAETPA